MKICLFTFFAAAVQSWNTTVELVDTTRISSKYPQGRPITTIVCGADGPPSPLPVYIFSHGFDCFAADYEWLCKSTAVVAALVISPEFAFTPDNKDMAMDQAFLTTALPDLAKDASSAIYGRLSGKSIFGGHSMGGGTSVLAAGSAFTKSSVDALVLFAPGLYTTPPAYPYRANISVPLLVVSGAMDCGPNTLTKEALPLYQNVSSSSRALVSLKGGNHCQWTTADKGVCAKPECHSIEVEVQQEAGRQLLQAFVTAMFGGDEPDWAGFESFLATGHTSTEWDYLTMNSASSDITNNCPCDGGSF